MNGKLIGIMGKKGHGKDTAADHLVQNHNFTKMAFATPLKEVCRHLFGFSDEQLYGNLKEDHDPFWDISPRTAMQFIGTDIVRNKIGDIVPKAKNNNDFWIMCFEKRYDDKKNIVISDVRFENEANFILEKGGFIIKIVRDIKSTDTHISEAGCNSDKIKYIIENNGTLEHLYGKLDNILI